MQGNNTLKLNHATIIEVLQLWVDVSFKEKLTVKDVKKVAGSSDEFEVTLFKEEPQEQTP